MSHKTRIIVIYGGQSVEHTISCRSAAFIARHLDRSRYDISCLSIDQEGIWRKEAVSDEASSLSSLPVSTAAEARLSTRTNTWANIEGFLQNILQDDYEPSQEKVIFPICHGTNGEDGHIQGIFEYANYPYVGSDVLGSALAMDKIVAKKLIHLKGIPVVPYVGLEHHEWLKNKDELLSSIESQLTYPMFVKPSSLGSSVGINKVRNKQELSEACIHAFSFDDRILVEKSMVAREIECSVLGHAELIVSQPGEIKTSSEFYDFDSKYIDQDSSEILIPAKLSQEECQTIQSYALTIFRELQLHGMARVDFFYDPENQMIYFNEANSIPGFTSISMYPKLLMHAGLTEAKILDQLIQCAKDRHLRKSQLNHIYAP